MNRAERRATKRERLVIPVEYAPTPVRAIGRPDDTDAPVASPWLQGEIDRIVHRLRGQLDPERVRIVRLRKSRDRCDRCHKAGPVHGMAYTDPSLGLRVIANLCPSCREMEPR